MTNEEMAAILRTVSGILFGVQTSLDRIHLDVAAHALSDTDLKN